MGRFYDTQDISHALFLGESGLAKKFAEKSPVHVARQIEPDGRQPLELARTIAWHYTIFNFQVHYRLEALGEHLGIDLWNFATADGRALRKATE